MSDKQIEKFNSLQNKITKELNEINERSKEVSKNTAYAKIHIKENINFYKIKSKNIKSSERNDYIVSIIEGEFEEINNNELSKMLSMYGFLKIHEFYILTLLVIYPILFIILCMITNNVAILSSLGTFLFVIIILLNVVYIESSIIKLYRTKN